MDMGYMSEAFLKTLLLKMKEDFDNGRFYREDSVKAAMYHHLRIIVGDLLYIYTESNYEGKQSKIGGLFDLVVSANPFSNGENGEIVGFNGAISGFEIKYINQKKAKKPYTHEAIIEAIVSDGEKGVLNNGEYSKLSTLKSQKIVFFVYEYYNKQINPLEDIINESIKQLIENGVTICGLYGYYNNKNKWEYKYSINDKLEDFDNK